MSATYTLTHLNFAIVVLVSWAMGALAGATLFYAIGRRHGIKVMAAQWRKALADDEVAKLAARAGAKVRGDNASKDQAPRRNA